MQEENNDLLNEMFEKHHIENTRPLFSEETTKKILSHMNEETATAQSINSNN